MRLEYKTKKGDTWSDDFPEAQARKMIRMGRWKEKAIQTSSQTTK